MVKKDLRNIRKNHNDGGVCFHALWCERRYPTFLGSLFSEPSGLAKQSTWRKIMQLSLMCHLAGFCLLLWMPSSTEQWGHLLRYLRGCVNARDDEGWQSTNWTRVSCQWKLIPLVYQHLNMTWWLSWLQSYHPRYESQGPFERNKAMPLNTNER